MIMLTYSVMVLCCYGNVLLWQCVAIVSCYGDGAGLDGSTNSMERDRLISQFNSAQNTDCWVFLLSTK